MNQNKYHVSFKSLSKDEKKNVVNEFMILGHSKAPFLNIRLEKLAFRTFFRTTGIGIGGVGRTVRAGGGGGTDRHAWLEGGGEVPLAGAGLHCGHKKFCFFGLVTAHI